MHVGIGILRMDKVVISHNPQFDILSHELDVHLSMHPAQAFYNLFCIRQQFFFSNGMTIPESYFSLTFTEVVSIKKWMHL